MATTVITGARVWTHDARFEERTLWVRDGRIAYLGTRHDAPEPGAHDAVTVLAMPRSFVLPGFVDAHFHLSALAARELRCDLAGAGSRADMLETIRTYASAHVADDAVVAVDFDESAWADPALPTRSDLDAIDATRPVYARRVCCHVGVANTVLANRLGGHARFVDAQTGRIVEDAVFEANRLTRPPSERSIAVMDTAIARLHALGVTAIHDIVDADSIDTYAAGLRASRRPLGIRALVHVAARDFSAVRERLAHASGGRAQAVGIKIFSDGSLGGRTAALHAPYADADTRGELLVDAATLCAELRACAEQGIECAVHAIGDRALATVLDAMEAVPPANGARWRIEHAEVMGDEEVARCARAQVPLVMQPNFVRNWAGEGGLYEQRLGRTRWERMNPFATLLGAGVPFVFSSDGMPAGPLYGLRGATHHPVDRQRIGPADALTRYTGAAADLLEGDPARGRIAAGAPADLVVLSGDPVLADVDALRVEATFVAGELVHRSPAAAPGGRSPRSRRDFT